MFVCPFVLLCKTYKTIFHESWKQESMGQRRTHTILERIRVTKWIHYLNFTLALILLHWDIGFGKS